MASKTRVTPRLPCSSVFDERKTCAAAPIVCGAVVLTQGV